MTGSVFETLKKDEGMLKTAKSKAKTLDSRYKPAGMTMGCSAGMTDIAVLKGSVSETIL
ncbi:MAG: hypothetical protein H8E46_01770 [FCB group bacterium]|nr:hypothetical protein [FCB group bacterium]